MNMARPISIPQKPSRRPGMTMSALMGLATLLAACSTANVWTGPSRPLVTDQPYTGAHRTMDYQLAFSYVFQAGGGGEADVIDFEGRLIPRQGLETFILRLILLDASGEILATRVLYAPGGRQGAARTTFQRRIEVPEGAVKLGFRHVARERRERGNRR